MMTLVRHDPDFMSLSVLRVDDGASLLSSSVLHSSHGILCEFILILLSALSTLDMIGIRKWAGFESRLFPTPRIPVHITLM
jgi:hypothetical protein